MNKLVSKIYYEINTEKCNCNRGAVSEALGIQKFIKKLNEEKGYECVGIINVCFGSYKPGTVTISESNKIISCKNVMEQLEMRNNYIIKMFILVNDSYGFIDEMENYLHSRKEFTTSYRNWVYDGEMEKMIGEMKFYEKIFEIDCYGESLNGYAYDLVKTIEEGNCKINENRIFNRYFYGNKSLE